MLMVLALPLVNSTNTQTSALPVIAKSSLSGTLVLFVSIVNALGTTIPSPAAWTDVIDG
jgi:hypothetical protein